MHIKLLTFAASLLFPIAASAQTVAVTIHDSRPGNIIPKELYGQFAEELGSCISDGLWVGPDSPIPNTRGYRNDVLHALQELHIPVMRWPGGCFADTYHWRDGAGLVHLTLTNTDPERDVTLAIALDNLHPKSATAEILTAQRLNDCNTFDAPSTVSPRPFTAHKLKSGTLTLTLPARSILAVELK